MLGNFNIGIDFTDWLSLDIRYSGQLGDTDSASRGNPYYGGNAGSGFLSKSLSQNMNQNMNQILRFNKSYGELNVSALIGHESNENRFKNMNAAAQNAILPNNLDLDQYTIPFGRAGSYSTASTLESYLASVDVNYKGKYYMNLSSGN